MSHRRRLWLRRVFVIDASDTWNKLVQEMAVQRMVQAGVVPITWVAVAAELQADWRRPTGQGLDR